MKNPIKFLGAYFLGSDLRETRRNLRTHYLPLDVAQNTDYSPSSTPHMGFPQLPPMPPHLAINGILGLGAYCSIVTGNPNLVLTIGAVSESLRLGVRIFMRKQNEGLAELVSKLSNISKCAK